MPKRIRSAVALDTAVENCKVVANIVCYSLSAYVSIRQHTSAYVSIGSALALDIAGENCKVVAYLVCGTSRGSEKENAK